MSAGARGGIGDAIEVGLFQQHGLRIAGDAAGEGLGQAERGGVGQHRDAFAPPTAAARVAMVPRTMFPCASRLVIMRQAVSPAMKAASGASPQASSTRDQSLRRARNLAVVRNWS